MLRRLLSVTVPPKAAALCEETRDRLERDARETLLTRTFPGTFVYPVITAIIAWSSGDFGRHPTMVTALLAFLSAAVVCRVVLLLQARRRPGTWGIAARAHLVLGMISSMAFASYAGFTFWDGSSAASALGGLITAVGIASSVVTIASIHRPLAVAWGVATLLPVVLFSLAIGSDAGLAVGGLFGLYLLLMIPAVRNAHESYWKAHISAASLEEQSARMAALARAAGMAEVSSNILHDVGNTMNGFKSTAETLRGQLDDELAADVDRFAALLSHDEEALRRFVESHPSGEHLIPFIQGLGTEISLRTATATSELDRLDALIAHIDAMLRRQRALARADVVAEPLRVADLISRAILLADVGRFAIERQGNGWEEAGVVGDEQCILQILVNFLSNSADALRCVAAPRIEIEVETLQDVVRITVLDNGIGTPEPVRRERFERGATTKAHGHGIGLHHAANLASAMGGGLRFESAGPGAGATAILRLPRAQTRSDAAA